MEAFTNLWSGRSGLAKAYWGWGVLGGVLWGAGLAFVTPGSAIAMVAVLAFFAYAVAVHVGVWRAASQYEGAKVWARLAKAAVILTPACIVIGTMAAVIIPAMQQPQGQTQQAAMPMSKYQAPREDTNAALPSQPIIANFLPDSEASGQVDKASSYATETYTQRVHALRRSAESGSLPIVVTRQEVASDKRLGWWPAADVAAIEGSQTWWINGGIVWIHVSNRSAFKMDAVTFEYAPRQCNAPPSAGEGIYNVFLQSPVYPGSEALIQFSADNLSQTNNGCLTIVGILG